MCLARVDHTRPPWNFHRPFLRNKEKEPSRWIPGAWSDPADAKRRGQSCLESRNWNDLNCLVNAVTGEVGNRSALIAIVKRLSNDLELILVHYVTDSVSF